MPANFSRLRIHLLLLLFFSVLDPRYSSQFLQEFTSDGNIFSSSRLLLYHNHTLVFCYSLIIFVLISSKRLFHFVKRSGTQCKPTSADFECFCCYYYFFLFSIQVTIKSVLLMEMSSALACSSFVITLVIPVFVLRP